MGADQHDSVSTRSICFSTPGGTQYVSDIAIRRYSAGWYVWAGGEWIGYWPISTFDSDGISQEVSQISIYGEVTDKGASLTTTDMGSGDDGGWTYQAYVRTAKVIETGGSGYEMFHDVDGTRSVHKTDTDCYKMDTPVTWSTGNYFYYGGDGSDWSACDCP